MNAGVRHPSCVVCGLWPKPTLDSGHLVSHPSAYTDIYPKGKKECVSTCVNFRDSLVVSFSVCVSEYIICGYILRYDTLYA